MSNDNITREDNASNKMIDSFSDISFESAAKALSRDYMCIYYVNSETNEYVRYSASENFKRLGAKESGNDFFDSAVRFVDRAVYAPDRERVSAALDKEFLFGELATNNCFLISFRLLLNDKPNYVSMKISRLHELGDPFLVVGVNSIQNDIQRYREMVTVTYSSIAKALAADYFSIYYVDTETDRFIEYTSHDEYKSLGIEKSGDDFFGLSRRNVSRVIYPEDRDKVLAALDKELLLEELNKNGTFTLTYRIMFDGVPTYVSMKATRMEDKHDPHIVIGVNSIQSEMTRKMESMTYSNIAKALAADYFSIYYVDTETDGFIEFSSYENYLDLGIEQKGADFFALSQKNAKRVIYPEDQEMVINALDKDKLLSELQNSGSFSLTYRLMYNGTPTYVNMKARMMIEKSDKHIVIGISSMEAQMRREMELKSAREMANRDALTGVKSKHAFVVEEEEINKHLQSGELKHFAVAVCDVNGLKIINDTMGHNAGDRLIKNAAKIICDSFAHSPVYRVGGDEFVAVLTDRDYEVRETLINILADRNAINKKIGGVVVACGMSEYLEGIDSRFEDVFDRADSAMYENKKSLKKPE